MKKKKKIRSPAKILWTLRYKKTKMQDKKQCKRCKKYRKILRKGICLSCIYKHKRVNKKT